MRIISGTAKGLRLATPKGKGIRPVLDQVKESVFNILYDVEGLDVLDIFAGTGAMGLEALSRGAASCVFIDQGREAIQLVHTNLEKTGLAHLGRVIPKSAGVGIAILAKQKILFDLIFIDPPYEKNLLNVTLKAVAHDGLLKPDGLIIMEHHPKEVLELPDGYILSDERKYGQTMMSFVKRCLKNT